MLQTLFEDWLQSGESWMHSSLAIRISHSNTQKRRGRHVLLPYGEVKKKFGAAVAANILAEKKALEANKPAGDSTIFFMEHPEAKGQEETWLNSKVHVSRSVCPPYIKPCCLQPLDDLLPPPHLQLCLCQTLFAQDWQLLRIWDAMEFEEEHNESVSLGLEGQGNMDGSQTQTVL